MTTLVYNKLLNRHLVQSVFESAGKGVRIELSEPIDGKLVINTNIYRIKKGVCRIEDLTEGEIIPKIYTGMGAFELERFVYRNGVATICRDHANLVDEALQTVDHILERLAAVETELNILNEKVSRRISILGYGDTETNSKTTKGKL